MFCGDSFLDHFREFIGLLQNLFSFCFRSDKRIVVVNYVSLPAATVKIIRERMRGGSHRQFDALERNLVVTRASGHSIPGAGDRHFRALQRRVVCRGEAPVCR